MARKGLTFAIDCVSFSIYGILVYRWDIKADSDNSPIYVSNHFSFAALPPNRGWWIIGTAAALPPPILFHEDDKPEDWRLDPQDSLSDFRIDISTRGTKASTTTSYHVHKVVLANLSTYFDGLYAPTTEAHFCRRLPASESH
jgi:hypothetical protein